MTHADDPIARPRLPDISLPTLGGDATVPLRARRQATVLVVLPDIPGAEDERWLRALAAHEPELRGWDGRVLAVVGSGANVATFAPLALPFPVLVDEAGRVARTADVVAPGLVVADQYGEVYSATTAGAAGMWMPVEEVEQWVRMLAIRCAS